MKRSEPFRAQKRAQKRAQAQATPQSRVAAVPPFISPGTTTIILSTTYSLSNNYSSSTIAAVHFQTLLNATIARTSTMPEDWNSFTRTGTDHSEQPQISIQDMTEHEGSSPYPRTASDDKDLSCEFFFNQLTICLQDAAAKDSYTCTRLACRPQRPFL